MKEQGMRRVMVSAMMIAFAIVAIAPMTAAVPPAKEYIVKVPVKLTNLDPKIQSIRLQATIFGSIDGGQAKNNQVKGEWIQITGGSYEGWLTVTIAPFPDATNIINIACKVEGTTGGAGFQVLGGEPGPNTPSWAKMTGTAISSHKFE